MPDNAFPIITVADLHATRRFYEQLGFLETYAFPRDEPVFVTLERGTDSIGISAGGAQDDTFG
jgi:lactoylglutathione lyase